MFAGLTFHLQVEHLLVLPIPLLVVDLQGVDSRVLWLDTAEAQRPILQQLTAAVVTPGVLVVQQQVGVGPPEMQFDPLTHPSEVRQQLEALTAGSSYVGNVSRGS